MLGTRTIQTWRSKDLAHWQAQDGEYFITFRVQGSLPEHLGGGTPVCKLGVAPIAAIVIECLKFFDHQKYQLYAWCVMNTHVHVVAKIFELELASVISAWKSNSAKRINEILGRQGAFWQRDYFDYLVRDDNELWSVVNYVKNNPIKAGLADWPWVWVAPRFLEGGPPLSIPTPFSPSRF